MNNELCIVTNKICVTESGSFLKSVGDHCRDCEKPYIECYTCWDSGVVQCNHCDDNGEVRCDHCNGDSADDEEKNCYHCDSSGRVYCQTCLGSGQIACDKCEKGLHALID